jgi:hypothetical protein
MTAGSSSEPVRVDSQCDQHLLQEIGRMGILAGQIRQLIGSEAEVAGDAGHFGRAAVCQLITGGAGLPVGGDPGSDGAENFV